MKKFLFLFALAPLLGWGQSVTCPPNQWAMPNTTVADLFGNTYQRFCVDANGNISITGVSFTNLGLSSPNSTGTDSGVETLQNKSLVSPTSTGTDSGTETLQSKRVSPRQVTIADATSITPNSDTTDIATQTNTQAAGTLTLNAPTGTPSDGQKLLVRIKTTNAQTYSFNAVFSFSTTNTAPTTTAAGKTDYIGFMWNATNSKWDCVGVDQGH